MSKDQLVSDMTARCEKIKDNNNNNNNKKQHCEDEIKWLNDYERQLRMEAKDSLRKKDLTNYLCYLQKNYLLEISSDDDYRSSSVKEFEDVVKRSVKGIRGKKKNLIKSSSRLKQFGGIGSRQRRKARPKRKSNNKFCEPCCPFYLEKAQINYDVEPTFSGYSYVNKRRPKSSSTAGATTTAAVSYPTSRLIRRRYSGRLISPKSFNRFMKKDLRKDYPSNIDIKIIQEWPDQRISKTTRDNKGYRSENRRVLIRNDCSKECLRKRSDDSIYINPRLDCNLNQVEAMTLDGRKKEFHGHRCYVDKTNENSFQKRLSGGSNLSGSTNNNQYCPRLNGPCTCIDETDKSKNCCLEKGRSLLSYSSKRKQQEKNISDKNCDWRLKNLPLTTKSKSGYPSSRSFTSISSTRSTKGVSFDKNINGTIPIISERTPPCHQVSRLFRKNDKSSLVEKKVHYETKCVRTNDSIKDNDDLCCLCKKEQFDNTRNRKLCNLVHSKEGKVLMKCCCSENEQEDNRKCNEYCCCPENVQLLQTSSKHQDVSTTYEKFSKDKDFLHSTTLYTGNDFQSDSTNKFVDGSVDISQNDLSSKKPFLDHWDKCNERLKEVSKDYQILSNNLKVMRDICYRSEKMNRRKATDEFYSRERDTSLVDEKILSPKRTTDLRSPPVRRNEIDEIDDYCDCKELFRETLPSSTCPYDRNEKSFKGFETRRDTRSKKKLERDSLKKLENFCDRVKATNRNIDNKLKENLEWSVKKDNRICQECRCDSETSLKELWKPVKKSTVRRKELPGGCGGGGNSVDLRIVKPKNSYGKISLDNILIYPPDDDIGPPLTLFKNSSNINCQVKGDEDRGFRYKVTYVQKFISPTWKPAEIECPGNRSRHRRDDCDCSSDYG
ncbi:hypothetical protein M0802_003915 [Mischocyttarus mexicanus]|nr:hypothetical protein M0802_003915 [Mischocyttarus mexicanus]